MRAYVATVIIISLWIYGGYLFATDGRTRPASLATFTRRFKAIFHWKSVERVTKQAWSGVKREAKSAGNTIRDMTKTDPNYHYGQIHPLEKDANRAIY